MFKRGNGEESKLIKLKCIIELLPSRVSLNELFTDGEPCPGFLQCNAINDHVGFELE